METWKPFMVIKNAETCELTIKERIGNSVVIRKVKIQNGKVIDKPKDVNIVGINTSEGFIIHGLELKKRRKEEQ